MKHLGDITKINGAQVPPVDIITGGSPCQDLSIAGKRAGLAGERSGLFMEQIRIIKEMRDEDRHRRTADDLRHIRPRFMLWENVPGAFTSNGGEDFRAVLEETARIAEPGVNIPRPSDGKWPHAGIIMADGWSIAWRLHDAQYWGVPQRRKRIALVADFAGGGAPEILFERKGMSGDLEESGKEGEDVATDVRSGVEETGRAVVYGISAYESNAMKSGNPNSGIYEAETARTLDLNGGSPACNQGGMAVVCLEGNGSRPSHRGDGYSESETMYTLNSTEHHAVAVENHPADSRVKISEDGKVQTLSSRMGTGGGNVPMVMESINGEISGTLDASYYKGCGERQGVEREVVCVGNGQLAQARISDKVGALNCMHDQQAIMTYGLDRASFNQGINAQYDFAVDEEKIGTQVAQGPGAVCENGSIYARTQNQVLRLLSETYGAQEVEKWGIAILATLQSSEILQSGMYESSVSSETENRHKLDGGSLPCPSVVAGWLLRDMRKQQECGCSSHRRQSTEQQPEKSEKGMPELSQQNPQTCKEMFDMWEKGEGLWLLREALSEIQEVRQSFNGKGQSVHGCSIVRRLTPLEAERLQGYPDHWTDIGDWIDSKGKKHKGDSDAPRYKALGNSIALPFWEWMAGRMVKELDTEAPTMASLFDGIGGFPLVFSRHGVAHVWASEIEEFPIAVTKRHFPEREETNTE